MSRKRQIYGSQALIGATLVAFWFPLRQPEAWAAGAFYVWIQVFGVLLVSQFFLLGNDLFDPRQAKRIYGFIGAGGLAGGVAGSAAAGFLANEIGSVNLLWLGLAMIVASAALAARVFHVGRFRRTDVPVERESVAGGLDVVRHLGHLQMIAAVVFLAVLASTLVDWLYNSAVEMAHPDMEEQTEFIGQSFAIFNAIALAAQVFLTSPLLRVLGLTWGLMALPVGLALGVGGAFVRPGLWTASAAKGADTSLAYSIDQSAREILYLPIPRFLVQRAKPFIDVVVRRLADGVAGVLLLLGATALGLRGLSLATLGVIGLWIVVAARAGRTYRRTIERLLRVRDVDLEVAAETSLDSATVRELLEELDPDVEAIRVHTALDLLAPLPPQTYRNRLMDLLDHPVASVRARVLEALADAAGPDVAERARRLESDPSSAVRAHAALLLIEAERNGRVARMEEWLDSDDADLLEAALTALLLHGDDAQRERAVAAISRLVRRAGGEGVPGRLAVARALARLPRDPVQRHLETLLRDHDPNVLAAAITSAGKVARRDLLEALYPHLGPRETRSRTRRALAEYGEAGLPDFAAALRDPDLPPEVRRWLPGVFAAIGTRAAYRALLEGLPAITIGKHRLYALKSLNKTRRRHPRWSVAPDVIRAEVDRELALAYDLERRLDTLQRERARDGLPDLPTEAYEHALGFLASSAIERAFRLQGLLYSPRTIYFAYAGLTGGNTAHAAHALELLETSLRREDAARIVPLIDPDVPPERRVRIGRQWYPVADQGLPEDLEDALANGEPWFQAYAVRLGGMAYAERLGPALERLAASGPPPGRDLARMAIKGEDSDMALSAVDKAAALRRAELLSGLGADDLLQLAAVAEERSFPPGEYLFYEGEEGDYMYVILDGRVRAERGGAEVFVAGPGETIGTFSILDREPRSASARAIEPARTLALHRADMAQILADNYSLVEGLFAYLTRIIRRMNTRQLPGENPPRIPE